MHFFKYTGSSPTYLENAVPVVGYDSVLWVEKYADTGTFKFEAELEKGLQDVLTRGSIISHVDTLEFGIVETHRIKDKVNQSPTITISGRMFDSYLDERIVGMNEALTGTVPSPDYVLAADSVWKQAAKLINDHIWPGLVSDANASLENHIVAVTETEGVGPEEERVIPRGSVRAAVYKLLAVANLGLRTVRRNDFGVGLGDPQYSEFYIHSGVDRSNEVVFAADLGELEGSDSLFSIRGRKNAALVRSRYVEIMVYEDPLSDYHFDRRILLVDASDLDQSMTDPPTGAALTTLQAQMQVRGAEALVEHNDISLINGEVTKRTRHRYRADYDIGDIVSIQGRFGNVEKKRVVEFVESEDRKNGYSGQPTLGDV